MDDASREKSRRGWSARRKLIWISITVVAVVVALAIGLGVGLRRNHSSEDESQSSPSPPSGSNSSTASNNSSEGIWKPEKGLSWNYQLKSGLNTTNTQGIQVWDIDLFDNDAEIISGLKQNGARVICYFSAGSYEDWRSDKGSFNEADLGRNLDGWPGERWINISSSAIRQIMIARLDLAAEKKCDGVDPDNVDGYDNENGLDLTEADSIDYMLFLSTQAHQRALSIGLKNAGAIIPSVINSTEWSVNEQCLQYNECDTYSAFIQQNKPVFHVEYPKGEDVSNDQAISASQRNEICDSQSADGFSTIIKNIDLDTWIESC